MRTLSTLLLAFLLAPVAAQTPCDDADHTILAGNYYYNPATLTINAGETVAWVNEGGFHDVNGNISVISGESFGNPEVFSLPSVSGDASGVCMGTHTFTVPGTYNYDCSIGNHAANGMVGTIIVEEAVASGCNDALACNYDEAATSDADCIYVDTPYDLSDGVLVGIPFGQYDLDTTATCAVQPINDNPVQMNLEDGQATFIVDDAVIAYFDNAVAGGLVSQEDADFFLNLMQNATMTFCGDTMVATLPVFGEVVSGWTGSHWMITPVGYYIAPISTVPVGCGDPAAENFDLCVINDPTACEYGTEECNDPLACNYDENATNGAGCNYFDTELFTIGENDFVDFVDTELCNGYATYNDFPIPLGQDSTGGPLYFTLFPAVEQALIDNGLELAAQDISTVSLSVCDTVMNYNSLVIGDVDMYWDGMGFINLIYGSYVVPESSIPLEGCPDPSSCNWNPCTHPFYGDECTYAVVGTIEGDSIVEAGSTVTFTGVAAEGNSFDWYSDCDEVVIDGNTITVTGTEDCEICFEESDADGCEGETCLNLSIVMSIGENGQLPWQFMPNPAADALRVVWGGDATVFEVVDLNGRRVHTTTVYRGVTTLDLSHLQPGLYLAGPQGTEPQRLAIQR